MTKSDDKAIDDALSQKQQDRRAVAEQARKPFGAMRQKGFYPPRDGYHRHWINDEPGRVERALEAGYKHVIDPKTREPIKQPAGVAATGGVLLRYLMEIPQEWWDADQAALQKEVDEREAAYKVGADGHGTVGADGRYIPAQGIKIQTNRK